jgi:adhesin transport system outer membrane protein
MNAELGRQRVDDPASLSVEDNNDAKTRNQLGVRAELVLFDGFRRANLIYANAARVDGSIFRLLDASETMALNATEAYIDVHRHRALEVVARRNVEKHEEIGRRVRDLVEGGRLPYSDQLTIEDRTDSARLALVSVQSSLRDANARYERVIGRAPSSGMSISPAPVPSSLVSFTAEAVENSYRVQFARTQIDQSRFQAEAVLSDRLPRVALSGGWVRDKNRNGVTGHRTDEIIGLNMTWLLYQGGRQAQRNALAELTSRAMAEQSVAVRDVTELAARTWNSYQTNSERTRQLREQLEINRLLVAVYEEEFEAAKRTLLDLLEIERARFNVEFESVGAEAGLVFSSYRTLATRSQLAAYFGLAKSELALEPEYLNRMSGSPINVFDVTIEPLK